MGYMVPLVVVLGEFTCISNNCPRPMRRSLYPWKDDNVRSNKLATEDLVDR